MKVERPKLRDTDIKKLKEGQSLLLKISKLK